MKLISSSAYLYIFILSMFLSVAGLRVRSNKLVLVHTPVPLYLCTSYLPLFHPGACIKVSASKSLDPTIECTS